jgi:hypothetical protein
MQRNMTIRSTGFASAVPVIAGVIGGLFGGWLTDWLMALGLSPIDSRRYPMTVSLLGNGGLHRRRRIGREQCPSGGTDLGSDVPGVCSEFFGLGDGHN